MKRAETPTFFSLTPGEPRKLGREFTNNVLGPSPPRLPSEGGQAEPPTL